MPPNLKRTDFSQSCGESLQHFSLSIGRRTATYCMQKRNATQLKNFEQKSKSMSKNEEIKKLRERIEALEFIKKLQAECRPQLLL